MKLKALICISVSAVLLAGTSSLPCAASGIKNRAASVSAVNQANPFAGEDANRSKRIDVILDEYTPDAGCVNTVQNDISGENSYLVKFKGSVSYNDIDVLISPFQFELIGSSANKLFAVKAASLNQLQTSLSGKVDYIEQNGVSTTQMTADDPEFADQWALAATKIPEAWEISKGAPDITVAMIDSGVSRGHEDLAAADIRQGWDYVMDTPVEEDLLGHGTMTTGIIAATTNNAIGVSGVCWNVAVIPFKVFGEDNGASTSDICSALYDAADSGADIINLSLGSSSYSTSEAKAVSYAVSKGCIVVAAAGNESDTSYSYPASYDGVISAAAITRTLVHSYFSNINNRVDVSAPGSSVLTTAGNGSGYESVNGTSFSSPYVAGIAALALAYDKSIDAFEFNRIIKYTSADKGTEGYDDRYGYGVIDAENIMKYLEKRAVSDFVIIDGKLTEYNGKDSYVTIPESVTSIGDDAFSGCSGLTGLAIPESVTGIENGVLKDFGSLIIYGYAGSYAQTYAGSNSITFIPVGNLTNFAVITGNGSPLGDNLVTKVAWYKTYKKISLRLGLLSDGSDYSKVEWSSDNPKVVVDSSGNVTNIKTGARAANITVKLTDSNGVTATDTVRVIFYKFKSELKRLS